jgi:hypothetical protein
MKVLKVAVLTGTIVLTACHHENPLKKQPAKGSAYFLMNSSANVEKRLGFNIKLGDRGLAYLECLEGKKDPDVDCKRLLQGMVAFAKEGHYPAFKSLSLEDLQDKTLESLADDILETASEHWPTYFEASK